MYIWMTEDEEEDCVRGVYGRRRLPGDQIRSDLRYTEDAHSTGIVQEKEWYFRCRRLQQMSFRT